jgi:transcriptional regulator with XRE-family HTH domain
MPRQTTGKLQNRNLGRTFLKEWRHENALTPTAAAKEIGIERSYLGRIERGTSPYHQRLLERAAEVYKCAPFALISYPPEQGAPREIIEAVLESVAQSIGHFLPGEPRLHNMIVREIETRVAELGKAKRPPPPPPAP